MIIRMISVVMAMMMATVVMMMMVMMMMTKMIFLITQVASFMARLGWRRPRAGTTTTM